MFEYKPHHQEVRGDGDGKHAQWGQLSTEANPQEEVEQNNMQAVVHEMCAAEADAVLCRCFLLKGEVGRHIVVGKETDHVAHRIGYIDVDPMLEYPVDDIVDCGRGGAHHSKTHELAVGLSFDHEVNDYGCKGNEKKWKVRSERWKV